MKKTKAINKLFLFLFLLTLASPIFISAQTLDHRLGEVLVQFKSENTLNDFLGTFRVFNSKKTELQPIKSISDPWKIWSFRFNHNKINEFDFLKAIQSSSFVENAQFDFFIDNRTIPDDFNYPLQWYLNNSGQSGGTTGVDLDAQLAWATTTGGITLNGDTIVICIVDENFDINHEDLIENLWINRNEIPDNGFDDDGNDYVDDYYGYNAELDNGDVSNNNNPGQHGTRVTGIAGAKGNNGVGISGVNWNVKLMLVSRGNLISEAIAAYTYPFRSRKAYNNSNGQNGAFVVATNSSWGMNFGWPSDAPLWCAMYDSLGSVGILNAAATVNANVNVDELGDLPSTCQSNFLITTTRVDHNDVKPANAGYGLVNVDLGAFGTGIWTTSINDGYGTFNGTSAAAPQVAGAIALLYSAPCPSFAEMAVNQPAMTANLIKDYIMQGTEPNSSLSNITVSGGRLNLSNSLNLLMDDCDFSGCFPPYTVSVDAITENSAQISWFTTTATTAVHIRYRKVGNLNWIETNNINSPFTIPGLEPCNYYEYQLASECENYVSNFSASYTIQSQGCCFPPSSFSASNIEENQIALQWNMVQAASSYTIRYRQSGTTTWVVSITNNLNIVIPGLLPCSSYEFQIKAQCNNGVANPFSESLLITTLGCGACLDLPYCSLSAKAGSNNWISQVEFSNLSNNSGNSNTGYSDFSGFSAELIQGYIHELTVETDYDLFQIASIFNIWIDFNQDGLFNNNDEQVYSSASPETFLTNIILIPANAQLGPTRLRIAFLEQDFSSCGSSNLIGEVEDYCVDIVEPTECLPPVAINSASFENSVEISWLGNFLVDEFLVRYRSLNDTLWFSQTSFTTNINIENLSSCTDYIFNIQSICNGEPSSSTPLFQFRTMGCGSCLDESYCNENQANTSFEWIESVHLNTLGNISGNNQGYAFFQDHSTDLAVGESYSMVMSAGFASSVYEEYFKVWIDFNQNGAFEEDEVVLSELMFNLNNSIFDTITVPNDAITGSTRMRIIMKYQEAPTTACDYGFSGEIEEYCINIYESGNDVCEEIAAINEWSIGITNAILEWEASASASSYILRYKPQTAPLNEWIYIATSSNFCFLENLDSCSLYDYQLRSVCSFGLSDFSPVQEFQTFCIVSTGSTLLESSIDFEVFPNPAQNDFNLRISGIPSGTLEIHLLDTSGRLITRHNPEINTDDQSVELAFPEDLSEGLYFLKILLDGKLAGVKKVVKM